MTITVDGRLCNENVREIQQALNDLGADLDVNGIISNQTIRRLQRTANALGADPPLVEDGKLGNGSIFELQSAVFGLTADPGDALPEGFTDALFDINERLLDGGVQQMAGTPGLLFITGGTYPNAGEFDFTVGAPFNATVQFEFGVDDVGSIGAKLVSIFGAGKVTIEYAVLDGGMSDQVRAWIDDLDGNDPDVSLDMTGCTFTDWSAFFATGSTAPVLIQTVVPDQTGNGNNAVFGDGGRGATYTGFVPFTSTAKVIGWHTGQSSPSAGTMTLHVGAPFDQDVVLNFDATVQDLIDGIEAVTGVGTLGDLRGGVSGTDPADAVSHFSFATLRWSGALAGAGPTCTLDVSGLTQDNGYGICGSTATEVETDLGLAWLVGSDSHGSTLTADYDRDSAMWIPVAAAKYVYAVWVPDPVAYDVGGTILGNETCTFGWSEDTQEGYYDDAYIDGTGAPGNNYLQPYWAEFAEAQVGTEPGAAMLFVIADHGDTASPFQHIHGPVLTPQTTYAAYGDIYYGPTYNGLLLGNYTGGDYCAAGRWARVVGFGYDTTHDADQREAMSRYLIAWARARGINVPFRAEQGTTPASSAGVAGDWDVSTMTPAVEVTTIPNDPTSEFAAIPLFQDTSGPVYGGVADVVEAAVNGLNAYVMYADPLVSGQQVETQVALNPYGFDDDVAVQFVFVMPSDEMPFTLRNGDVCYLARYPAGTTFPWLGTLTEPSWNVEIGGDNTVAFESTQTPGDVVVVTVDGAGVVRFDGVPSPLLVTNAMSSTGVYSGGALGYSFSTSITDEDVTVCQLRILGADVDVDVADAEMMTKWGGP